MQEGNDQNNPGFVFRPGGQDEAPQSSPTPIQPIQDGQVNQPQAVQQPAASEPSQPQAQQPNPNMPHVEWSASEYVANHKTPGWFITLGFVTLLATAVVFLITRDIVSSIVMLIIGLMLGIFGARQPNVLNYAIDNTGIYVGNKFYDYESFKWFSVINDHGIGYIYLMPLKRFMPPLTIHYAPDDEDKIGQTLADYLPYEDHQPDVVDSITRRFRF